MTVAGRPARYYVTGTDTDVGKTRVSAALAAALVARNEQPAIVKLVQTGLGPSEPGDAALAGALAGCRALELARFALPADPWNAALAAREEPLRAAALAERLTALDGPLVLEGAGGAAVPLNADETLTSVAALARARAIVVVGLRLGCINHARLTLAYLAAGGVPVDGAVLVERWGAVGIAYRAQVVRTLAGHVPILAEFPFDGEAARSVAAGAAELDRSIAG